jgi:hypothetical protein
MQRLNIARVVSEMERRTPTIVASLSDYRVLEKHPTVARVIMTVNSRPEDSEKLYYALASALGNKAAPIRGSFRWIDSMGSPALYGFVAANVESKPYDEALASTSGMVALASSNMFMDPKDESLWTVRQVGGQKMLARQGEEDLSELMVQSRVYAMGQPVLAKLAESSGVGEYIAYVNPEAAEVRYGYVLSAEGETLMVIPNHKGGSSNTGDNQRGGENAVEERVQEPEEPVAVQLAWVVESVFTEQADAIRFEGAGIEVPDSKSREAMKVYYREMFKYDPGYYAKIEQQINEHAAV